MNRFEFLWHGWNWTLNFIREKGGLRLRYVWRLGFGPLEIRYRRSHGEVMALLAQEAKVG